MSTTAATSGALRGLALRGISHTLGRRRVLSGVDLTLAPGECVAVLGPSGSGKTTLARLALGLMTPRAGTVTWHGAALTTAARRDFALVQQRPGLLRASACANVAMALRARGVVRETADERARAALAQVGASAWADQPARALSGGQAQRVALARALVTRPRLLVLDEPTNQLDPEAGRAVEAAIRSQRAQGAAVLLVTHSPAQAGRVAERFVFVEAGRVVAAGSAASLQAPRDERLARFVAMA